MADLHMADFYRDTASILVQLYNQFPQKTILFAEDICGPNSPDEFGLPSPRFQRCFSSMIWLAEAGLLHYTTPIRQEALDQAVLSRTALVILFSPVDTHHSSGDVDETETTAQADWQILTHIDLLRTALKSGSSRIIEQVVQSLLRHPSLHP